MERVDNSPSTPPPKSVAQRGSILLEPSGDNHSRNYVKQEETSDLMQSQVKESEPMRWTDEKHSLYLKSMEASFVNQLHDSLDLLGWHSLKYASSQPKSSSQKDTSKHNPRGQFKCFQDGCWRMIGFGRGESELKKRDESGFLLSNSWIQHYRSGCRRHTKISPSLQEKDFLANVKDGCPAPNFYLCRQDSVGCNTGSSDLSLEVTDQNFTDEDSNEEKKSETQSKKRMKTTAVALPNHDQVVPSGKCSFTEDVAENNISSSKM